MLKTERLQQNRNEQPCNVFFLIAEKLVAPKKHIILEIGITQWVTIFCSSISHMLINQYVILTIMIITKAHNQV